MNKRKKKILITSILSLIIIFFTSCISKADENEISSEYFKIENNIISQVAPKTPVTTFKKALSPSELQVLKNGEEVTDGYVGTNMIVKYNNKQYRVSVVGDFNGDGEATQVELTNTIRHIVGFENSILEGINYISADITLDGNVDQRDIRAFIRYIVFGELNLKPIILEDDDIGPTVNVDVTDKNSSQIGIEAEASDDSGIKEYTYYIKKSSEDDNSYEEKGKSTSNTFTFEDLDPEESYDIKIVVEDGAGNVTEEIITVQTEKIPDLIISGPNQNITITYENEDGTTGWTNGNVRATFETTERNYVLKTSKDGTNWENATIQSLTSNDDKVYVTLSDGKNHGNVITAQVDNIDKTNPQAEVTINNIYSMKITAEVTASDADSGLKDYTYYIKKTSEDDSRYVQKEKSTNTSYTFTGLEQEVSYTVKVVVEDNAKNKTEIIKTVTTKKIPDLILTGPNQNVTITYENEDGSTGWTNGNVRVTFETTEEGYTLQTSKDGTNWENTNIQRLTSNNDKVYATLTDGNNHGNVITAQVDNIDKTKPTASVAIKNIYSMQMTAEVTASDSESGINDYTYYIKKTSEDDSRYVQKEKSTNTSYTFTGLEKEVSYTVKVVVVDKAKNKTEIVKTVSTNKIPDLILTGQNQNVTITYENEDGSTGWTNGNVRVTFETTEGFYTLKTSRNRTDWDNSRVQSLTSNNDIVYAALTDGTNFSNIITAQVDNIDKTNPTVSLNTKNIYSMQLTAEVTASDTGSGIKNYTYYIKKTSEDDSRYVQKEKSTNTSYTFTGLEKEVNYDIKVVVEDNAKNKTETVKTVKTQKIPDLVPNGENQNITIRYENEDGTTGWTNGNVRATFEITEEFYTLKTSRDRTNWVDTRVYSLTSNNDIVYATLTDGTNYGNIITAQVSNIDKTRPNVVVNIKKAYTTKIEVEVTASDSESGLKDYTYYIKKSSEDNSQYVQKAKTTSNTYTFEGLTQEVSYDMKVAVEDNAKNKTESVKSGATRGIPNLILSGQGQNASITYENEDGTTGWTNGNVRAIFATTEGDFTLKTSKDRINWADTHTQILTSNEDIAYGVLTDGIGYSNIISGQVDNIDKIKPEITSVFSSYANTMTAGGEYLADLEIKAKDTPDAAGKSSLISGYAITTTNTRPTEFTNITTPQLETTINVDLTENTYYLWIKDRAGNVSDSLQVNVKPIPEETYYTTIRWYEESGVEYGKTSIESDVNNYIIQYKVNDGDWIDCAEGIFPNVSRLSEGDIVYSRLVDGINHGNITSLTIEKEYPRVLIEGNYYTITPDNLSTYIGRVVTNYNGGDTTWRLFYVDFGGQDANGTEWSTTTGKYGEGYATIYLKKDVNTSNDGAIFKTQLIPSSDYNEYTPNTVAVMKKLNPMWNTNNGTVNNTNERIVSYFNNPTEAVWSTYKDPNYDAYTKWIIGAPSLEMFCDSYCIKNGQGSLVYDFSDTNVPGYLVGANNSFSNNNGFTTANNTLRSGAPYDYGVYEYHGFGMYYIYNWFLGSPSAYSNTAIMKSGGNYVGGFTQMYYPCMNYSENESMGVCPLVCLDKTFTIEMSR